MLKYSRLALNVFYSNLKLNNQVNITRCVQTVSDTVLKKARKSKLGAALKGAGVRIDDDLAIESELKQVDYKQTNRDYRFIYPDFLPDPIFYFRDKIRERLERKDMIERRKQLILPEFYVGSILAVTCSDPYAPNKINRFVGICIRRDGYGLRHQFTLRNVVDGLGVEIAYDLYNPTIQYIQVLKLEKRLDDDLTYLRDCPLEYSTIPFDMEQIKLPPDAKVPVNDIKIMLNPKPWRHRWERKYLKGAILPAFERSEHAKFKNSSADFRPYERYDLMKHYRDTIHDEDHADIVRDIKKFEKDTLSKREETVGARKIQRKRELPNKKN